MTILLALYPAWLAMMALHEGGHVLHAVISGGRVARVTIPLLGFSYTELSSNPWPGFVAWGGPVWGSLVPLGAWLVARRFWRRWASAFQSFAGFCLIANGVYIAAATPEAIGDAETLLRTGTPAGVLYAFGAAVAIAGLYLWHDLGRARPERRE
ncbi:MAG: hypothetical protein AMXMBFR47_06860 [Planctomycetota bacterium]